MRRWWWRLPRLSPGQLPIGSPLQAAGRGRQPHRLQAGRRGQGRDRSAGTAEPIEETADVAQIENSSITTEEKVAEVKKPKTEKKVAEKPAKKAEQKVATAGDLGCKTFFASVGMTLSVPCGQK